MQGEISGFESSCLALSTHLSRECVCICLEAHDREDALLQLASRAEESGLVKDARTFLDNLKKRETEMSTGVGRGLAVPHAEVAGAADTFVIGATLVRSVDYKSLDDLPVDVIFLIGGKPGETGLHLQILARIARMARQPEFLSMLREQSTTEGFVSVIEQAERSLYSTD